MMKNRQSSHQVLDSDLGYYLRGLIINTSVFSEFSSKKLLVIQFFYIDYAFHKLLNLVCFTGPWRNIELSIISITVKANPVFPNDISQG